MICKYCETENPDHATFCKQCGKRINGKRPCPACGSENDEDAVFCTGCGARLDGKTTCPHCGTLTEGAYCTACGANVKTYRLSPSAAKQNRPARAASTLKYVELAAGICAMIAVFCALLFTFFIGISADVRSLGDAIGGEMSFSVKGANLWYFFGDGYRDTAELLEAMEAYSGSFLAAQYVPLALGTLTACATLITVITFSALAAVRFGKKTAGKSDRDYFGFAVAAVACFFLGANLLKVIYAFSMTMKVSYGGISFGSPSVSGGMALNGATTGGIVLCALCLAGALACRISSYGREIFEKSRLVPAILSAVAVVLLGILVAVAAQGAIGFSHTEDGIKTSISASFTVMMQILTGVKVTEEAIKEFVVLLLAQIAQFALIALIVATLISAMKSLAGGTNHAQLALSIATFAVAIAHLVLAIVAKNLFCDYIDGISSENIFGGVSWSFTVPIACVVLGAINFGRAIAQKAACRTLEAN